MPLRKAAAAGGVRHFRSPLCFTKIASSRPAGFSWSFDQPYHPASLYPIKRMNDVAHG